MDNPYSPPEQLEEQAGPIVSFSFKEAATVGWKRYRENFLLSTGVAAVWTLLMLLATNSCIGLIVVPHLAAGWAIAGVSIARNKPRFEAMFSAFESFGPIMAAGGLLALLYTIGFILVFLALLALVFILTFWAEALSWKALAEFTDSKDPNSSGTFSLAVMGIGMMLLVFVSARFQLAFNLVMERKLPPIEAFRESWKMTKAHSIPLGAFKISFDLVLPTIGLMFGCLPGLLFALPLGLAMRGAASNMLLGNIADPTPMASITLADTEVAPVAEIRSDAPLAYTPPPQSSASWAPGPSMSQKKDESNPYN